MFPVASAHELSYLARWPRQDGVASPHRPVQSAL